MKKSFTMLIMLSMFSTFFSVTTLAQSDPFAPGYKSFLLPPEAVQGATPESQASWAALSPAQKETYGAMLDDIIQDVRNNLPPTPRGSDKESTAFRNDQGSRQFKFAFTSSSTETELTFAAPPRYAVNLRPEH